MTRARKTVVAPIPTVDVYTRNSVEHGYGECRVDSPSGNDCVIRFKSTLFRTSRVGYCSVSVRHDDTGRDFCELYSLTIRGDDGNNDWFAACENVIGILGSIRKGLAKLSAMVSENPPKVVSRAAGKDLFTREHLLYEHAEEFKFRQEGRSWRSGSFIPTWSLDGLRIRILRKDGRCRLMVHPDPSRPFIGNGLGFRLGNHKRGYLLGEGATPEESVGDFMKWTEAVRTDSEIIGRRIAEIMLIGIDERHAE